jgi:flagellar biosynthesis/type III secretory pathway chaperone
MNAQSSLAEFPEAGHCGMALSTFAEAESECFATAWELHQVLEEEADILKRFAKDELLKLIPRKQFLTNEMGQKLQCMKNADGLLISMEASLKDLLGKINRLNRSNRVFIERSLAHWKAFLAILVPSGYRPPGENPRACPAVPRGFTFNREV